MHRSMSDVEALLSVDSGKVPPGVVAFFARDPEASKRRVLAAFAVVMAARDGGRVLGGVEPAVDRAAGAGDARP